MSSLFRQLTLTRIGAVLFVVGLLLLAAGAAGVVASAASGGSGTLWVAGLSGGQALLLGLACLVSSAVVFAHAITLQRLARVEAKLDALASKQAAEKLASAYSAQPGAPADRPRA